MRKVTNIILLLIILLASFLRFYRLGDYPALNADEAAIGYNAYSLIQTGKDEHGNAWPIHFQSFNDYKPGLYFYLVLPFVKILGLNEWSVRIPGATLGVLTVLVVYFLIKELEIGNWKLEILAPALLAISPWHIHFSRGGWEVNAATFFITLGVWLFLKALKKPKYFILSSLFLVFSLYAYHAARIVVPLLVIGFLVIYRNIVRENAKAVVVGLVFGLLLLVPLVKDLASPAGISRAVGVGLLADPGPLNRINEQRGEHADFQSLSTKLFHNKPVNYSLAFWENWGEHFWGEFLFLSGDEIQRNRVPETGQVYLFDIIFVLAGLVFIVKKPSASWRNWAPIILWLVVAPTAAALTFQSPHALRAHNMVIPLVVISAFGLVSLVNWLKNNVDSKRLLVTCYLLLVALVTWQFARYQHMYWLHLAKEYPFSSQYGLRELVLFVKENEGKYDKIIVTDTYDQPYILFLFYSKYPPEKFQREHELTPRDKFGFSTVRAFDKYQFQAIDFDAVRPEYPNSLIVGTDEEIPEEANIIEKIYFPGREIAFEVVAN